MPSPHSPPVRLVVMGVSGCGKSSLGQMLAADLGLPLIEGDDFHPPSNVLKMQGGTPLTDADRAGWLARLGAELQARQTGAVLTCSALKHDYRERLRAAVPRLGFVFMQIERDAALARVQAREAVHIFPASLVDSQFQALESPVGEPGVLTLQAVAPLPEAVARVRHWLLHEWARAD